jgi:hypothetical protein
MAKVSSSHLALCAKRQEQPIGQTVATNISVPAGQAVGIVGTTIGSEIVGMLEFQTIFFPEFFNVTFIDSTPVELSYLRSNGSIALQAATSFESFNRTDTYGGVVMYYIKTPFPSTSPSIAPSRSVTPSSIPSSIPSKRLSASPTGGPSSIPSTWPTTLPSSNPSSSSFPSAVPSLVPTKRRFVANIKKCLRRVFRRASCQCKPAAQGLRCLVRATKILCERQYQKKKLLSTKAEIESFRTKMELAFERECRAQSRAGATAVAGECITCRRRARA